MNTLLATGADMSSVLGDLTSAVAAYGTAAATLVGAVVVIAIGLKWVKKFSGKAS